MAGVWVAYDYRDEYPYAMSIHATYAEAEAEISEVRSGYICLWPFEMDLVNAISDWVCPEKRYQ